MTLFALANNDIVRALPEGVNWKTYAVLLYSPAVKAKIVHFIL